MKRSVLCAGIALACAWQLRSAAQAEQGGFVQAVYETRLGANGGQTQTQRWSFSRRDADLDYHFFASRITEHWSRDARANASFVRVFHRERTAVRYTSGDLAALNATPDWAKLWHVVAPPSADGWKAGRTRLVFGHEARHFQHATRAKRVEIVWLGELGIPAEVRVVAQGRAILHVRLVELSTERPPALDLRSFRQIDATDFGDMERDPFVHAHHADPPPSVAPLLAVHGL